MKSALIKAFLSFSLLLFFLSSSAQIIEKIAQGEIHGNFQTDVQYYNEDTLINAIQPPEKLLMNGFANLTYTNGPFNAGLRYESYLNALQGFDPRYRGSGITYRFFSYAKDNLEITAGNFYEQFGSGLLLRAYEERNLGYDNVLDGFRVKYSPISGVYFKGLIGRQRSYFNYGPGIVRGIDGEVVVNELGEKLREMQTTVILGGSFVSKFQEDTDPVYNLPENVGATAGRINLTRGRFNLFGEYAYKINDPYPGASNSPYNYSYRHGEALFMSASYSQKGLGATIAAKRIDNMNFRSDRYATLNDLMINYLPPLSKQHVYNLAATLYPYATQPNGEIGYQADIVYTAKKGTLAGGKYGTTFTANYSAINNIDTVRLNDETTSRNGYKSGFFDMGDEVYFRDFNIEMNKKLSPKVKLNLMYVNLVYNMEVIQGLGGKSTVYADIEVADISYKINNSNTIRTELQHLRTGQDQGNWATGILEYTHAPNWFVAVMDQYNYGNAEEAKQIHYIIGSVGYIKNASRITLSYGRQRAGIFCVGGVCRNVPASNGLTLSITSSF